MKLLTERGEVILRDKFISPRIVKDTLSKYFKFSVIDERSNYIKLRIIRLARLYGFPFLWPQASIEIWIKNENDKLIYKFFWPEYFTLIIPSIILPLINERVRELMSFFICAMIFYGLLMFFDTKWVSRRFRSAFEHD